MAHARERVLLITIRVARETGASPVIVAREHQVWPATDAGEPPKRSTVGARPDEVLTVVSDWLREFVGD